MLKWQAGSGGIGRFQRNKWISEWAGIYRPSKKTSALPDYNEYHMKSSEIAVSVVCGAVVMGGVAFVFFKSIPAMLVLALFGLYAPVLSRRQRIVKRKAQLKLQFKQMLAALSSSLSAGKSVESAFQDALLDVRLLYPSPEAMIVKELEIIVRRLENGETAESALFLFSRRTHIEEIIQFADVFVTCKRTGGNLVQVIRRTAGIIQDKLDIEQDIQVGIAQKKFESNVLAFAPVVVVAVLTFSSADYMEPLYRGGGRLIMGGALIVLLACFALTRKIMNIKI